MVSSGLIFLNQVIREEARKKEGFFKTGIKSISKFKFKNLLKIFAEKEKEGKEREGIKCCYLY